MSLTIEALPDLAVELSVDAAEPLEGATVRATMRVRNVEPAAAVTTKRFRVRLVRDAAAGDDAEVLVDQLVSGAGAGFDRTFLASWDTAGHVGARTLRAEVDPERALGEHVVDNNVVTMAVTVLPADRPDLAVTTAGLTIDPADTAVGSTATVRATVSNRTDVAAADVMVELFAGDPDSGGTPIGEPQTIADLPGRATADVSVAWDTTGLSPGARPVFVRVDGLAAIDETNEDNNEAARGFELRLDDAARPADLAALVTGHDVQLSWTAPALPVAGT
jgi:subtilase family serine protease